MSIGNSRYRQLVRQPSRRGVTWRRNNYEAEAEHSTRGSSAPYSNSNTNTSNLLLEFVSPPPREVERGSPIHEPVVLRVRAPEAEPQEEPLHHYFAVASLVTSDRNPSPMPQGALTGPKLADSIHAPETTGRSDVMGYLSFPYLSMQSFGSYKLRVTLMKLDLQETYGQSAVALQAVDSGSIQVTGERPRYQPYY